MGASSASDMNPNNLYKAKKDAIPRGHAFTVVFVKEALGNKLLNIRSALKQINWEGDWKEGSKNWNENIKKSIGLQNFEKDGSDSQNDMTFWMSYQEVVTYFKSLNVCRVRNWNEVRIKGKFLRVQDVDQTNLEVVLSKWYYSVEVLHQATRVFIGMHQEDERIKDVSQRRPYLDVSIAILKRTSEGVELVDLKDFVQDR